MSDVLGLEISEGSLVNILNDSRGAFQTQMALIRRRLLAGTVLQSDETAMPSGTGALNPRRQHGQVPRCRVDAGHHRLDRRQLDMVVGVKRILVSGRERVVAMRAGIRPCLDDPIGALAQRPEGAGMPPALLRRPPLGPVRLLPLARRHRGIIRRLRRLAELRFQILDPLRQHIDLRRLPGNNIRLRQDQRDQSFVGEGGKRVAIHRTLESRAQPRVNPYLGSLPSGNHQISSSTQGVSSYPASSFER